MKSGEPHTFAEIDNKIFTIRDARVMLDSDLAEIYGVETKVLNQAVKRNTDRFPDDFIFRLTKEEFETLSMRSQSVTALKRNWSQIVTSSKKKALVIKKV